MSCANRFKVSTNRSDRTLTSQAGLAVMHRQDWLDDIQQNLRLAKVLAAPDQTLLRPDHHDHLFAFPTRHAFDLAAVAHIFGPAFLSKRHFVADFDGAT